MNSPLTRVLVIRVGVLTCALKLAHVVEVMRPLSVQRVANTPGFLRGMTVIRGAPVPVVCLAALFGEDGSEATRFVVVRAGNRLVALAADAVLGVLALESSEMTELPPLAANAFSDALEAIGVRDQQLLAVLDSARIVAEEFWEELGAVQW
jgi:purine-binding chemotaxis protein CheW